MTRSIAGPLLFVIFAVVALLPCDVAAAEPGAAMRREVGERIEFDSTARGKKERVWGNLSFPSVPQAKYPLMLILHASGGIHAVTGSSRALSMKWAPPLSCSTASGHAA